MFIYRQQKEKTHLLLHRSLELAKTIISNGEKRVNIILSDMNELFSQIPSANLDYIKIVEAETFEFIDVLEKEKEYFVLIACKIGKTRLIDNTRILI